jgi:catechol 2,3-dioxygenase-like lactoylglutathione lyase family enzyme
MYRVTQHGTRLEGDQALEERPAAQEEAAREATGRRAGKGAREAEVSLVTAVHFYVTDLDRSLDWYTRLLGRPPAAAYDEGENAQSAFFVLGGETTLVLTWDPERGRESGGSVRLELAAPELAEEITRIEGQGIEGGRLTRTRFGTEVYDLADPDGHLLRVGPPWTLHAIEGAV